MDPITHAALGASCSQAILGKYNKNIPWQIGALAAMAPDLDIFIRSSNDPLTVELWHRSFTHSLLFIPLGGILVALFFLCFPRYRVDWKVTLIAALVGYATHGLLDAFTSYGTLLLWPISYQRISWDIIAIVDPLFTIPLILGIVWSVTHQDQKGVLFGLLFAGFFLLFNGIQHHRALQSIRTLAAQQDLNLTSIRAMPELASSVYWRVIAKNNRCLLIQEAHTPVLKRSFIIPVARVPLFKHIKNLSLTPKQQRDLAIFSWFSDDYMVVTKVAPLTLADGRYTIGSRPLYALWGIEFLSKKAHIKKLSSILLDRDCEH